MAKNDPQVNFRVPKGLLDKVKAEAVTSRRTQTAQLALIIEEWFNQKESAKA
ncbi:Arc family DNA-binding protein [Acinetobacter ursingii]|uniref:Arc family DNA-binding protein n=1 Tax=Acinetobacter ursingii TaxID=108980 RepID=UPI0032B534F9